MMAKKEIAKDKKEAKFEIVKTDEKAIATIFNNYCGDAIRCGYYVKNWNEMLVKLQDVKEVNCTIAELNAVKESDGRTREALNVKFSNGGYDCGACPVVKFDDGIEGPSRVKGVPRPSTYGLLALDADKTQNGFDDRVIEVLKDFEFFSHSTISSTDSLKKRRVVIPLTEQVTADVREALVRFIANKINIEEFDPASVKNKQLMTLPVHCKDGEFYQYHNNTNNILNPIQWLNENAAGWENVQNWPRWKNNDGGPQCSKSKDRPKKLVNGKDIYEEIGEWLPAPAKNKIQNAFNKVYRISDVLKESGKYELTSPQIDKAPARWSHTYDNCKDGIKVTNDGLLFSYYGTDPLSTGTDLDAFEVALILRFGDLEEKQNWRQMFSIAANDYKVTEKLREDFDFPDDVDNWEVLYDITDEGLARRCLEYFPHKRRNGKWMLYKDGIYKEVNDSAILPSVLQMFRMVSVLQPTNEQISNYVGTNKKGQDVMRIWKGFADEAEIPNDRWENQPWLLHFTDCTIDLKAYCEGTGNFKLEHNPKYLLTNSVGYPFELLENANENKEMQEAFAEVDKGMKLFLPDESLRHYFWMAMGRSLTTASATEDKCVWLLGREGGNGKSTILRAIAGALGNYYYHLNANVLYRTGKDENSEGPTPAQAGMENKRMVMFNEFDFIRTLATAKYKSFTSAEETSARRTYSDNINFDLKCSCFIDSNGMPNVDRREGGLKRRTRVIPFEANLEGIASGDVKQKWKSNVYIHAATMMFLLLGLKAWYENGRNLDYGVDKDEKVPEAVVFETMNWINAMEDPSEFFNDYLDITNNEDDFIQISNVYRAYLEQVTGRGLPEHSFKMELTKWLQKNGLGVMKKRQTDEGVRRMCYVGLKLNTETTSVSAMVVSGNYAYRKHLKDYQGYGA